ncbi:phospholipid-translocating P-type ATPase [Rickenella mellea]|uniref:Phospholipid-transporting ATPase n=1 Tax=Rickenella mellea TaxID=50990 RepID=A0A4Y7QBP7_9AGAM|nr:phospholipid-translocating P-type ATPase [Rickenella mellea]
MSPKKGGFAAWYDKFAAFNVESLFVRPRKSGPARSVFINEDLPSDYFGAKGKVKKEHVYTTNQVVTSKYTIITFLPRNLMEQFRRIANVFFLAINILQFFPKFGTISPGLVILPLLAVLLITALKDGYEDIKRHDSDRRTNYSQTRILNGGGWENPNVMGEKEKTFMWSSLVPSFLKRGNRGKAGEQSDNPETSTVAQQGVPPEAQLRRPTEQDVGGDDLEFDEVQERAAHEHGGIPFIRRASRAPAHWKKTNWEDVSVGDYVKIKNNEPFPADLLICATSEEENVCFVETKGLDGETNLKSRNAVPALTHLRSASICSVKGNKYQVDCEKPDPNMFRMNGAVIMPDGSKSPIDLQTVLLRGTVLKNTDWIIGVVLYTGLDTKIVQNSGGTPSKRSKVERQMNPQVFINLIILACMAIACGIVDSILEHKDYPNGAPWLYGDNTSGDNPSINGLATFAFALITFQNIIPISLYISIEVVRTCQAAFIYFDKEIWYEKTDQPTLARSWNLSDDLGQIEYIFSDKTGTLTQNAMVFRHCSINGQVYRGEDEVVEDEKAPTGDAEKRLSDSDDTSATASGSNQKAAATAAADPIEADGVKLSGGVLTHFRDEALKADLEAAVSAGPDSDNAPRARALNGFFSVLALCHTVLASVDPTTNKIEYKAQSPDEAALVQAAADVGFVFRGRDKEVLRLQTPFADEVEKYELLNLLDFTSSRKRMSVLLRKLDDEDSRIFLFSKGADNVIFERLKPGVNEELKKTTEEHLDNFASEGLRTLTLAYKVVPDEFYEEWSERYHDATVAIEDREAKIERVSDEIEHELRLLGATAIEDRLQDGVPQTIADLKRAGIKVWVATGDKLETAIAIGYSTNLIGPDSNLVVVRGGDPEKGGRSVFDQMYQAVEDFFPESGILEDEAILTKAPSFTKDQEGGGDAPPQQRLRRVDTGVSSIVGRGNGDRPGGFVLVIEGVALGHAFDTDESKELLLRLAMQCEGVICCRVSPLQKAQIVKLVKDGIGAMTLAIGDGANDVSMIQAADVGVGISGEEGLQAVNSSDYAIGQFRFLKRLLLVHGHWSYARNGNMIVNFFYKNIICIGILWWFQIYCAWSSQYVFEYTYLLFWNVFWSIAPVIAIGIFDRIIDDDILMALPELYRYGREGKWFGTKIFLVYMIEAVYQSAIIFFIINYTYVTTSARTDGYGVAMYEFSTVMVLVAVMVANAFNGLNTSAWTWWVVFATSLGVVLVWLYTAIYSLISPGWFAVPVYGNDHYLFRSAICWLCMPLTFCLALAPRYLAKAWRFGFSPNDIDIMRWIRKTDPHRDIWHDATASTTDVHDDLRRSTSRPTSRTSARPRPSMDIQGSRTDMSTGLRTMHRGFGGFDFSTEEHGVAIRRMQTDLSEKRINALTGQTRKRSGSRLFSLKRSIRKKKPPTPPS